MKKTLLTHWGKALLIAILVLTSLLSKAQDFSRTRISMNGGWGYRFAKTSPNIPQQYRDVINGLRSGVNYGADFTYYFSEHLGAGIKYNHFGTSVSTGGDSAYLGIRNIDVGINFIGGTFGGRIYNKPHSGTFIISLSLGYLGYTEKGVISSTPYKATGGTFGGVWDIGYDFRITPKIAIGAQVSILSGVLRSYTVERNGTRETISLDQSEYENLARVDLSGGIRFTL